MVLHDLNLVAKYCDKVMLFFENKKVCFRESQSELTEQKLTNLYTHPIKIIAFEGNRHFIL